MILSLTMSVKRIFVEFVFENKKPAFFRRMALEFRVSPFVCTVPGKCDKPLQKTSRNQIYCRVCRVACHLEMRVPEPGRDFAALLASFGFTRMRTHSSKCSQTF